MTESALVPHEEKNVTFYGDTITIAVVKGKPFVPVRPITDALGLSYGSQYNRIRRDEVLSRRTRQIAVTAADGKQREMICLPLELLPGWLFGLKPRQMREELQEKMTRYREECFATLWEAFQEGRLTAEPSFSDLLATDSPAAQAYKMAEAMMQLARNQLLLESHVQENRSELEAHAARLDQLEETLGDPKRHITPAQAMQISQAVKGIAMELSKRTGRNEYGGVYGELYRKFEINSYKILPASRFEEAMKFLNEWYQSLVGEAPF